MLDGLAEPALQKLCFTLHRPVVHWRLSCDTGMQVKVEGPDDAASGIFKARQKSSSFQLTAGTVDALQAVFGPEWSKYEAVCFVYAALGISYADGTVRVDSHAQDPIVKGDGDWLEGKTKAVCGVGKAKAQAKKGTAATKGKGAAAGAAKRKAASGAGGNKKKAKGGEAL